MAEITIYTSAFCGYCASAKSLLKSKGQTFDEIDVAMDAKKREEMVKRSGGGRTVPQIFINGQHVGGSDELHALDRAGKLESLLSA